MRARSHIATAALLALGVFVAAASAQPAADPLAETPEQRDARMAWWRDARFGMFIHWGLYAIPAGRWGDSTNHAEWIRTTAQIPVEEYDGLLERFNPVNFDAAAWARAAHGAGMRYIVITAKHHDGFCLFDSAHTEFDVMSTPFGRDIIRELADAARAEGLQIGFYYSIMDWHHPDYLPRRGWEEADRPAGDADFERYEDYLHAQVTELLTNYGPIGVMWFDGEWESTWSEERGRDLYALCRRLQPDVIVNNRVGAGREGMAGLTREGAFAGDFGTPEQEVPATGIPDVDWESCMTMNDHWGYNAFDTRWKSATTLIRTLVDIASKGGNFLLNVGPRADGTFPPEAVDRLGEMGRWMRSNGPSIYSTQPSPFDALPWGRCTVGVADRAPRTTTLFLHVFDWPADRRIVVPGVETDFQMARYLALRASFTPSIRTPGADREQSNIIISNLTRDPLNAHCTVIELITGPTLEVFKRPDISAVAPEFTDSLTITLAHDRDTPESPLALRYTLDATDPSPTSPAYDGPLVLHESATVRVQAFRGHTPLSPVAERRFERVEPIAAVELESPRTGALRREHYEGTWDRLPRFDTLTPVRTDESRGVTLDGRTRDEYIAQRLTGYLYVRAAGVYRFGLASDDGSRLFMHDRLIVDNDGLHVTEERTGAIALGEGWHPITIEYFNRAGGYSLTLRGEIVGRDMVEIPARAFAVESPREP